MSLEQRERRLLNLGTVLLVILLIVAAIGVLISVGHTSRVGGTAGGVRGSLNASLTISTRQQGSIDCPFGASFSPDGSRIAVLGSQGTCDPYTTTLTPQVAAIYDTHSGVMSLFVRLEPLIGVNPNLPLAQQTVRSIRYFSLGWSPDGHTLAIIYTAFSATDDITPDTEVDAGLILLDTEHGTAHVLRGDSSFFAAPGTSAGGFPIWNVATGTEIPAYTPDVGLAFAWNAHGMPYPIVKVHGTLNQLPITAGLRYPVGNPDGNSTFTIWQPGLLLGPGSSGSGSAAAFTTVFPSWSPDGKYVTLVSAGAQLPVAQQSAEQTNATRHGGMITYPTPSVMPSTPARDAALVGVQRQIGANGWALVAWNPSGTLLASLDCAETGSADLEIRSTTSAVIQGSVDLPLEAGDSGCHNFTSDASAYPAQPMMLFWSPDGQRVLVCDQRSSTITVWSVAQP